MIDVEKEYNEARTLIRSSVPELQVPEFSGRSAARVSPENSHQVRSPSDHKVEPGDNRSLACGEGELPGSLFDEGPVKFNCTLTELAHLQKPGQDGIRKFIGSACARGVDDAFARHNASVLAKELVFKMESEKEVELGAARESNEVFVTDKADYECRKLGP